MELHFTSLLGMDLYYDSCGSFKVENIGLHIRFNSLPQWTSVRLCMLLLHVWHSLVFTRCVKRFSHNAPMITMPLMDADAQALRVAPLRPLLITSTVKRL